MTGATIHDAGNECGGSPRRAQSWLHFALAPVTLLWLVVLPSMRVGASQVAYVANYQSDSVSVIDTATNTVTATIAVGDGPNGVAASADGSTVFVTNTGLVGQQGTVSIIDAATKRVRGTVAVGSDPVGVAVTPDGAFAYVANSNSASVSVIDASTDQVGVTISVEGNPYAIAITPDGAVAYVAGAPQTVGVSLISTATNTVTGSVLAGKFPMDIAITPDGAFAYVTLAVLGDFMNLGGITVIDTATNTASTSIALPPNAGATGVAITPDGTKAYVASLGGPNPFVPQPDSVLVVDTHSNSIVATIFGLVGPHSIAVSVGGDRAYVTNGGVSVIDTTMNRITATIPVGDLPLGIALASLPTPMPTASPPVTAAVDDDGCSIGPQSLPANRVLRATIPHTWMLQMPLVLLWLARWKAGRRAVDPGSSSSSEVSREAPGFAQSTGMEGVCPR